MSHVIKRSRIPRIPWINLRKIGTGPKADSYQFRFFFLFSVIFRYWLFFLVCSCLFLFLLLGNRRHVGNRWCPRLAQTLGIPDPVLCAGISAQYHAVTKCSFWRLFFLAISGGKLLSDVRFSSRSFLRHWLGYINGNVFVREC